MSLREVEGTVLFKNGMAAGHLLPCGQGSPGMPGFPNFSFTGIQIFV